MIQEEKLLIDRFLENSLTGFALQEFLDKLESDDEFKKHVSFQNLLIEGIQETEDKRLKTSIENFIDYKKTFIPYALKLIIVFLIITGGGITLWNYIDPDSAEKKQNYFTLNFFRSTNKDSAVVNKSDESRPMAKQNEIKNARNREDVINEKLTISSADSVSIGE